MGIWMLPVEKVGDEWKLDDDPILHGDDMTTIDEVDHLPTTKVKLAGAEVEVFAPPGSNAGYVRASDVKMQGV